MALACYEPPRPDALPSRFALWDPRHGSGRTIGPTRTILSQRTIGITITAVVVLQLRELRCRRLRPWIGKGPPDVQAPVMNRALLSQLV